MSNKIRNLKPDTVLKNYWRNNEQFADFFNAILFDGKAVIKAEELEDVDTEESSVLEHKEYAESIQASRDNIKIRKKSTVHGVDDDNAKKYQSSEGIEEDEYLSRMKRTDRFVPVISAVVYYGEKPWDGPTTLHEMLV